MLMIRKVQKTAYLFSFEIVDTGKIQIERTEFQVSRNFIDDIQVLKVYLMKLILIFFF